MKFDKDRLSEAAEKELERFFRHNAQKNSGFFTKIDRVRTAGVKGEMFIENWNNCRESILVNVSQILSGTASLHLDNQKHRQHGVTCCYLGNLGRILEKRRETVVYVSDIYVGLAALLLTPDRYEGDWWITKPAESKSSDIYGGSTGSPDPYYSGLNANTTFAYMGLDNTIMRHPGLHSLYLGLLRQAVTFAIRRSREDDSKYAGDVAISELLLEVPRSQVVKALTECDVDLAKDLYKTALYWIFPRGKTVYSHENLIPLKVRINLTNFWALHKRAYAEGAEAFGTPEQIAKSWRSLGGGLGYHRYQDNIMPKKTEVKAS